MSKINPHVKATSQIDWGLLRLAKCMASKATTTCAVTILSFSLLCTAKAAPADDIPGQLPITHSVSAAGATVASIPIPTLPGAGGLEPKLLLSYSSQGGNAGFGLGWSLNGYSTIVRGSKTRDVDGAPAPINYKCNDAFYLNGERIVPVAQLSPNDTTGPWWLRAGSIPNGAIEYRKWIDDGTLIVSVLTATCDFQNPIIGGIDSFVAETKSGIRTEFTKRVGDSILPAPPIYLPTRSIDTAGNYILWHFDDSGLAYNLSWVKYTGLEGQPRLDPFAIICFNYDSAPRALESHLLGQTLVRTQRLTSVVTTLNDSGGPGCNGPLSGLSNKLTLSYKEALPSSADAYYLSGAQLTALGDNVPAVAFDYKPLPVEARWTALGHAPNGLPPLGGPTKAPNVAYQLGKSWNGTNPVPALFLSKYSNGKFLSTTYLYSSNGWVETKGLRAPPVPFVDASSNSANVFLMDIAGNGYSDLLQLSNAGQTYVQDQKLGGWKLADTGHQGFLNSFTGPEKPLAPVKSLRLGSYSTSRKDLLVKLGNGSYSVLLNKPTGWVRPTSPSLDFSAPLGDELAVGDFNGDGYDDRVDLVASGNTLSLETYTWKPNSQSWTKETGAGWNWTAPVSGSFHLRAIKVNKSKYAALLISIFNMQTQQEYLTVLLGSQTGWTPYTVNVPGPLLFGANGTAVSPIFLDVNDDGLTDVIFDQSSPQLQQTWLQSVSGSTVSWTHNDTVYGPPPVLIVDPQNYIVAPWYGSSRGVVIIAVPSTENTLGATYLSVATGWQQNSSLSFAPSVSLVTAKQSFGSFQFVDLNGDGLQDVVYNNCTDATACVVEPCNSGQGCTGAEFNLAGQWPQHDEFAPPPNRPLAKPGDLGARVTFIDINGDGYPDMVYSYTENGTPVSEIYINGTPLQAQGCPQGWEPPGGNCNSWALPSAVVFTDVARGDLGCRFADINGDGLADIVCGVLGVVNGSSVITRHDVYINNGHGWDLSTTYSLPAAFVFDPGSGPTLDLGTQLIDVEGDRLPALIVAYRDPITGQGCPNCGIYENDGSSFVQTGRTLPVMLDAEYYSSNGYQIAFMDIDGDGLPDMVQFSNGLAQVYLCNGTNWDQPVANSPWTITGAATDLNFGGTQFVDVNGDGRLDIIYGVDGGASGPTRGVRLNTGNGWTPEGQNSNLAPTLAFISASGDDLGVRLVDVNGDGAPDQIQSTGSGTGSTQLAYANPGARVGMLSLVKESLGVATCYFYKTLVDFENYLPISSDSTAEFPGIPLVPFSPMVWETVTDESSDCAKVSTYGRRLTTTYSYEGFRFDLSNSIALGFARVEHTDQAADTPGYSTTHLTRFRQKPHLVGHPRLEQTLVTQNAQRIVVDETTKNWDELPVPVTLGGFAEPGYLQILLTKSVTKTIDLNGTGGIASDVETTFTYDNWLNAKTVAVTKPERAFQSLVNDYYNDADSLRYGRLQDSTSTVKDSGPNGPTVSKRTSTFTYFDVSEPQRFLLKGEAINVGDKPGDIQLNSSTTYERDERGNITSTTKSPDPASQLTGAPRRDSVKYDPQLRQVTRRENAKNQATTLTYAAGSIGNSLALPTSSTDPNQLTSTNTYDGLGRTVTQSIPGKPAHRFNRILKIDIQRTWLVNIDSSSQISVPKQDAPCLSASRTLTWTQQPIGFAEEERVIASSGAYRIAGVKIYDVRHRVIRSINYRTDGSTAHLTFTDYKYDTQGRLVSQSQPYFSDVRHPPYWTPSWTVYDYDALGRRILSKRPDGALSRFCYEVTSQQSTPIADRGLKETLVDARNHGIVVQLNLDGKPRQITRADGGILNLSYDAMGRVYKVESPSHTTTTIEFDGLGNRSRINDPNAGRIEYVYDAFGQLRKQRSGSQPWIELDYDELGREREERCYDQVTDRTYDQPGAVGYPYSTTLTTLNSDKSPRRNPREDLTYAEHYYYDKFLRLQQAETELGFTGSPHDASRNQSGTYTFSYDSYSVVDRIVYPKSLGGSDPLLVIQRRYDDATGQLIKVINATRETDDEKPLWRLESADASGHILVARYGNDAKEMKEFSPVTGRIESLRVDGSDGRPLASEVYRYDLVGNLISRAIDGRDLEEFDYDGQNRLTCDALTKVRKNGKPKECNEVKKRVSVVYDTDDRIQSKSDVGEYRYLAEGDDQGHCHSADVSAPDALCAVERNGKITDTFRYDQFGNLSNHDELHGLFHRAVGVDYTLDHHVSDLRVKSFLHEDTAQFYYGPSGQRILSRERNTQRVKETVYMGLYERISVKHTGIVNRGTNITDRFYVLGDQGVFLTIDVTGPGHKGNAGQGGLRRTSLYQHHDRLGSIILLTKSDGRTGARVHYDPWGKSSGDFRPSRDDNGSLDLRAAWTQGFTGQDHIPGFDLIHMTGRVYDPRLGIFLSVDPLGGETESGGDLDPYLYAAGNPLADTDPTGLDLWGDFTGFVSSVGQAVGNFISSAASAVSTALQNAAQWVGQNWREIASVAVIAVVTFATAGTGTGPVVAATLAGAAGDATETALYGGSLQDVIGAAVEGAVLGGFSAGLANEGLSWETSELAHGFIGGFQSTISGQDFTRGFVIGALSQVNTSSIAVGYISGWTVAEQVAVSAVINGAISEAQGDKFANGALTGAFQQLYLDADQGQWQIKSVIEAANVLAFSIQPQLNVGGILGAVGDIRQSISLTNASFISSYSEVDSLLNILQTGANDVTQLETAVEALKPRPPSPGLSPYSGITF